MPNYCRHPFSVHLVHRTFFAAATSIVVCVGCLLGSSLLTAVPVHAEDQSTSTPLQPISAVTPAGESGERERLESTVEVDIADQVFLIEPNQHAWTRFPVESWREIQVTTETSGLEGSSISRSVSTQVEKLKSVTGDRYALEVQATINVVGKQVIGQGVTRVLNTATDKAGQLLESHRQPNELLMLPADEIECQVWDIVYTQDSSTLVDHIYFAPNKFPYVLRRETAAASVDASGQGEGGLGPILQTESIVALEIPYSVQGKTVLCTCQQTVRRETKGSTVRIAMLSPTVPGGEIAVWSTDFNSEGQRTRWNSQVLVAYGQQARYEKPLTRRDKRRARRNR